MFVDTPLSSFPSGEANLYFAGITQEYSYPEKEPDHQPNFEFCYRSHSRDRNDQFYLKETERSLIFNQKLKMNLEPYNVVVSACPAGPPLSFQPPAHTKLAGQGEMRAAADP